VPGYMTPEEVIESYRSLDVNGVEIREDYWGDCTPKYLRSITWEQGLPINCYVFTVDLSLPGAELRQQATNRVCRLLDKTAELGAKIAMIFPAEIKPGLEVKQLRGWAIEGLSNCADYARKSG